jgi:vacuolar-type H+-ATPase subunit E/Vma4
LEEVEGVIEKERKRAMEVLDHALETALEELQREREKAAGEEKALREESRMELSRVRSSMVSEQELESRRLVSRAEDSLQEKLISEAVEDLLQDPDYKNILDAIFKRVYKTVGSGASVLYGADDKEIVKALADKYGVKVRGEASFARGFAIVKGDMTASYSIFGMVSEIKRNLKREIRKKVGQSAS